MADLTDQQKVFIVRRRARFVDISDIIAQFAEAYNVKLKPTQISSYDATTIHGQDRMSKDLQDLFHMERRAYLDDNEIPIASQNFRLKELEKMYFAPTASGLPKSDAVRASLLEQAAKEKGGLFRQRVSEQEAFEMVVANGQLARDAVDKFVTNPDERNRVHAEIQKGLAGQGPGSTP